MKVKVIKDHPGEGIFPTFKKGTSIAMDKDEDSHFLGWHACEVESHKTYVPGIFVADGALTRDYNPTELVQQAGDILEVRGIVNSWLMAANDKEITGWIPAEAVVSMDYQAQEV